MIKSHLVLGVFAAMVSGCASTNIANDYTNLPVTQNALQGAEWSALERFPARYPESAALNAEQGCATVEYVITPDNEVKEITVITATDKKFGIEAAKVIKNWKWSELPKGLITQAVKTQTRFDFCFDKPNQSCTTITPEYSCPSDDVIYATGVRLN